jgi:hypothetical protein
MQIRLSSISHPKIHESRYADLIIEYFSSKILVRRYADSIIEDFSSKNPVSKVCGFDY